jgi:hypothetical protein
MIFEAVEEGLFFRPPMRSCRVFEMLETFLKVSRTHVCVSAHHAIGLMPKNLLNNICGDDPVYLIRFDIFFNNILMNEAINVLNPQTLPLYLIIWIALDQLGGLCL